MHRKLRNNLLPKCRLRRQPVILRLLLCRPLRLSWVRVARRSSRRRLRRWRAWAECRRRARSRSSTCRGQRRGWRAARRVEPASCLRRECSSATRRLAWAPRSLARRTRCRAWRACRHPRWRPWWANPAALHSPPHSHRLRRLPLYPPRDFATLSLVMPMRFCLLLGLSLIPAFFFWAHAAHRVYATIIPRPNLQTESYLSFRWMISLSS